MRVAVLSVLIAAVISVQAQAVTVRRGDHAGFTRLVYEFDAGTTWRTEATNHAVTIAFDHPLDIPAVSQPPRNFVAIEVSPDKLHIAVGPNNRLHVMRIGNRLVLDAFDPQAQKPPALSPPKSTPLQVVQSPPVDHHDAPPPPPPPAATPTPQPAQTATAPSFALRAVPAVSPQRATEIRLPFGPDIGAAAIRIAGEALIAFDVERPIDISEMKQRPEYAAATVTVNAGATTLLVPLQDQQQLHLVNDSAGWKISVSSASLTSSPIVLDSSGKHPVLHTASAGRSIRVLDPETGGVLLLGTVRDPQTAVQLGRATPLFNLLPTLAGVALEPLSDSVSLQNIAGGFEVETQSPTLHLTHDTGDLIAQADDATLTSAYAIPNQPAAVLFSRLRAQMTEAALAPPLARTPAQRAAALTMIALGLGPEAAAELELAASQNPRQADRPENAGLIAMADVLAHRPVPASINPPSADDMTFWLALRDSRNPALMRTAGQRLALVWPVILSYGTTLKNRLLAPTAETLISSGQLAAAQAMLKIEPTLPSLAFARGMLAQARGETNKALGIYDALGSEADPLLRVEALAKATDLRLAKNLITKRQAVDTFDRLAVAWHGGDIERTNRLRLADLLSQTGQWRRALTELRGLAHDFPDQADALNSRRREMLTAFLSSPDSNTTPPLEYLGIIQDNTDVVPDPQSNPELQVKMVDHLLALDLQDQAASILQRLLSKSAPGEGQANYGARLAELQLRMGKPAAALHTLAASESSGLPPDLAQQRLLISARALAGENKRDEALGLLSDQSSPQAIRLKADLLQSAQDWPAAAQCLAALAAQTIPLSGPLSDSDRHLLLELAAAMARASDGPGLEHIRSQYLPRFANDSAARMLRDLTEPPIASTADLPRSSQEIQRARSLAQDLNTIH